MRLISKQKIVPFSFPTRQNQIFMDDWQCWNRRKWLVGLRYCCELFSIVRELSGTRRTQRSKRDGSNLPPSVIMFSKLPSFEFLWKTTETRRSFISFDCWDFFKLKAIKITIYANHFTVKKVKNPRVVAQAKMCHFKGFFILAKTFP